MWIFELKGDIRLWEFEIKCSFIGLKIKMLKIEGKKGKKKKIKIKLNR